jgi:aspartyl-tRNA(Asn)/glutamyl-tRNA(Gln) amidotransferase subunit B
MADYEEDFVSIGLPGALSLTERAKLGSNWLLGEVSRIINANDIDIDGFRQKVSPERLVGLSALTSRAAINTATAKTVLEEMFQTGKNADEIVSQRGLSQISDSAELEAVVGEVVKSNPQAVADFRSGKDTAIKFLVGQVMRATKGRANPALANELLKQQLGEG